MPTARTIPGTSSLALWSKNVSQSRADCILNRRCSGEPSGKWKENTSGDVTLGLERFNRARNVQLVMDHLWSWKQILYVCRCVRVHVRVCAFVRMRVCVCVRARACVCVCVCFCLCMCVCLCVGVWMGGWCILNSVRYLVHYYIIVQG